MNKQPQTLTQALLSAMRRHAGRICFKIKCRDGLYRDISYDQFETLTLQLANFFRQRGVCNGERVVILANNSVEWLAAYVACLLAGGVVVPLRISLSHDMLHSIIQASGACLAVVDGEAQNYIIEDRGKTLPDLKTIVTLHEVSRSSPEVTPISSILSRPLTGEEQDIIRAWAEDTEPAALASIHYTDSETGKPKGAVFNQAQRLQAMHHLARWLPLADDDLAFTFLFWGSAHVLDVSLHIFLSGIANVLSVSGPTLLEDMQQTGPTLMLVTPLSLENFYRQIVLELNEMPEASQEVFQWALTIGKEYQAAGAAASPQLQGEFARADMTFFSQIRGKTGGNMRRLYCVGALLPQRLADFIEIIGLAPLNLYSITEAGGYPAISRPAAYRSGSCGLVAPGFQIRVNNDGEILVKSPTVMLEYWQQPQETKKMIDPDGWFHTGDLGHFDEDGFLYLTGRKEALIVLSSGRKVMPSIIENALKESPFVAQAAVFGEGRAYLSALIVPDLDALADHIQDVAGTGTGGTAAGASEESINWLWQPEDEIGEPIITPAHSGVKMQLDKVVQEINRRLDHWERIGRYSLLEQAFSKAANDLADLTPAKRQEIARRYAPQIETMYPKISHLEEREITQVDVTPQRMRELLEKEIILDAWMADAGIGFLFDLARQKQIDVPSMVNLCDVAATIAQMENEERPLSTALIVGDPGRIARVLPSSQVQLLRYDHIRRMRKILVTMATMVDGLVLGYVIDKHGYVRGVRKLDLPSDDPPPHHHLLGPQFRHHAAISEQCNALVFFVPAGGRQVRVFADGQLAGRYSNGDWSQDKLTYIDEIITSLVRQHAYDLGLIQRMLRCAFQMSEKNLGAIFIIGDADNILEYSDDPEISHFASVITTDIDALSDRELINFARQDGATLIDTTGKFRGCMVLLRPAANTRAEIGPGKGARHSSAAKMSAEAHCLAIAVSQDGPITIYNNGARILSL